MDPLAARDPRVIALALPLVEQFNRRYTRLRVDGLEHIPVDGPALYVANHSGGILGPDVLGLLGTLWRVRGPEAPLYALAHDFAMRHLRPLGWAVAKLGAIRASRDSAARVFAAGAQALVYPGGDLDAYRHFRRRHEVVFGSRTGFVRVAQEHGVPIIPVVARGAHSSALVIAEGKRFARAVRLPRWARVERFPVALALPWGVALGPWLPYAPLPLRVRMRFLPPIRVAADHDPTDARDRIMWLMQHAMGELGR